MKGVWKRTLSCLMTVILLVTSLNFTIFAAEDYTGSETYAEGDLNGTGDIQGQEQYTVTVSKKGKGSISPEGDQTVLSGSPLSITMTPDQKYKVAQIKVDGNPISEQEVASADSVDQYDFYASGNQTVEIVFGAELSVSGHTYTVVGDKGLCEKEQDPQAYQNDMAEDDYETGTFKITYKDVPTGSYSFKISQDHSQTTFYGDGTKVEVPVDNAEVTITFKENTQEITTEVKDSAGNILSTWSSLQTATEPETTAPETTAPETEAWPEETMAPETEAWPEETTAPETEAWPEETMAPETEVWPEETMAPETEPETTAPSGDTQWETWETDSLTIPDVSAWDGDGSGASTVNEATIQIIQNENGSILPEGWTGEEKPTEYSAEEGEDVTFVITPAEGYYISGVVADFVEIDPNSMANGDQEGQKKYTFSAITGTHSIDAAFLPIEASQIGDPVQVYSIQVVTGANGTIIPQGEAGGDGNYYVTGETVQDVSFEIVPSENYEISSLLVDNTSIDVSQLPDNADGSGKIYTFSQAEGSHVIAAEFAEVQAPETGFEIQVVAGANGSITPSGTLNEDGNYYVIGETAQDVSFEIIPDENYEISSITADGVPADISQLPDNADGSGKIYTFSQAQGSHVIAAEFTEVQVPETGFEIQVAAGANGTILPTGELKDDGNYYVTGEAAADVSFEIIPNENYEIGSITVDGTPVDLTKLADNTNGSGKIYTFMQAQGSHVIAAEFVEIPTPTFAYRIQVSAGKNGTISPSGELEEDGNRYVTGETIEDVTFEIIPGENCYISNIIADGSAVDLEQLPDTADGSGKVYTFAQAEGEHSISAEFEQTPASSYHIHVTQNTGGTIQPSGDAEGYVEVAAGESCTFTIIPNSDYSVKTVVVDGVEYSADSLPDASEENGKLYTFEAVNQDSEIYAVFEKDGTVIETYTITANAGEGGTIDPSGEVKVEKGADQTFVITPDEGYSILSVEINGVEMLPEELEDGQESGTKQFTFANVSAHQTISAKFQSDEPQSYKVTSVAGSNGTISPLGDQMVEAGGSITFAITPDAGYHIDIVKIDGVELIGDELAKVKEDKSYTFVNVMQEHTLGVTFAEDSQPVKTYTIEAVAGSNGTISPNGTTTVEEGGSVVYTITPDTGYHISDVIINGTRVIGDELAYIVNTGKYTFTNVNRNHTIQVEFEMDGAPVVFHTIISSAGTNGTITPQGATTVLDEDNQTYVITPDTGYRIASVMIDGVRLTGTALERVQDSRIYTFYNVKEDHSIAVSFTRIVVPVTTYTIQSFAGENGSISPAGTVYVEKGSSQTYQISTAPGYHISIVKIDGVELTGDSLKQVQNTGLYTFTNVAADHTIGVAFEKNENPILTYQITYLDENGSEISNLSSAYDNYRSYVYGKGLILPTTAPYERPGYNFLGWYTSMTGGNKVEAISTRDSGNKVVYARWTQSAIPMIFDDKESGVMLSGSFNGSPKLWVVVLTPGNTTYEKLKNVPAMNGKKAVNAFDISIVDGSFTGNMVLTFAVNEGYNGKTLTVIHEKTDGTIETFTPVASNGKIVINVNDLGSFMLAANDADYLMYGPNSSVKTGDSAASTLAIWSVIMLGCAGIITVVLVRRKRKA